MWFRIDNKFHYRVKVDPIDFRLTTYGTHKLSRITWFFACHERGVTFNGREGDSSYSIDEQIKEANKGKVTRDEVEAAFLRGDDTYCKKCWNYDAQNQAHIKAKEEERKALVASKEAEGKPEVKLYHLITLLDLEKQEPDTVYLVAPLDYVSELPAGAVRLHENLPLGKAIIGRFVDGKVKVEAPGGAVIYRIVDVKPHIALLSDPKLVPATELENERLDIYEGKGRNGDTHSQDLDGGKYLGGLAREERQIGSYSIQDDYSDESDAEGNDEPRWLDLGAE